MRTRARWVAVLGIAIVGFTACGGGAKAPAARSPTPTPSATKRALPPLAGAYTVKATPCVNFRKNPEPGVNILSCVPDGAVVQADGQSRKNAGYTWYHVTYKKQSGWIASQYLQREGVSPTPSASTT
ncbi:MAG TPA: SH3 domain-containing protein [Actinomycetota bacterium]|nr:SH3 domain-containing protein [Actinomycetota bacterium]